MNDTELDELLRSARPPERPPGYWKSQAQKIIARLHWQEHTPAASAEARSLSFQWWKLGLVSACIVGVLTFAVWHGRDNRKQASAETFAEAEKCYREIREMFPNQICAIILANHGSRLDLAETANVPNSPAILLKICGPAGCETVITFSGQRIRVGGEDCDVLASGAGGVIVAGEKSVWTSDAPSRPFSKYRIASKSLKATL